MTHPTAAPRQSALLVGLALPGMPAWEVRESLDELARLADTATLAVADQVLQTRPRVDAAHYVGKGKANQLRELAEGCGADMIIFDNDLSPAQMRNLEKLTEMRILDRSAIILDIFARHARTRSAHVQVELAQLKYLLPRLTRAWTHLSRQAGGGAIRGMGAAGGRGPGETQLEVDRRLVRTRIGTLQSELNRIGSQMAIARKGRGDLFRVALVGYTNAGKSTLMRALSGADVLVQDQLFATLDSTTRAVGLEGGPRILLTDTVGFINRLPHHLFASFRATLEEAAEADLLLHVVDRSHPQYARQMGTVEAVLAELGIEDRPLLVVHNKIDRLDPDGEGEEGEELACAGEDEVAVSALTGAGLDDLRGAIRAHSQEQEVTLDLRIPQAEGRLLSQLHEQAEILEQTYDPHQVHLRVRLGRAWAERWSLERFQPEGAGS